MNNSDGNVYSSVVESSDPARVRAYTNIPVPNISCSLSDAGSILIQCIVKKTAWYLQGVREAREDLKMGGFGQRLVNFSKRNRRNDAASRQSSGVKFSQLIDQKFKNRSETHLVTLRLLLHGVCPNLRAWFFWLEFSVLDLCWRIKSFVLPPVTLFNMKLMHSRSFRFY
jgi:hypothetical protein